MAISNIGFNGSVPDTAWARLGRLLGQGACLERPGDLPITQLAGRRNVTLGLGSGPARSGFFADGILTSIDAAISAPAADLNPTNGQWFLLVATRDWTAKTTTFQWRNGATTATATAGASPTTLPASVVQNPGTTSDVPICWVWATSASTTVMIVPLMAPSALTFPPVGTVAQRNTYYATSQPTGAPDAASAAGAQRIFAALAELWWNQDNGQLERFYPPQDAVGNPGGYVVSGWYGLEGPPPTTIAVRISGDATWGRAGGGTAAVLTLTTNTPVPRDLELIYEAIIDSGGSNIGGYLAVFLNGTQIGSTQQIAAPGSNKGAWGISLNRKFRTAAGNNTIEVRCSAESSSATIYGNRPTWLLTGRI